MQKEAKEIRLFGEKSLREEAYRQKILQLEREVSQLESFAKNSRHVPPKRHPQPVQLDSRYYESLLSFDKKVRKEQDLLEKRAVGMVEKLDLQAQQLILSMELSFRRKAKWLIIITALSPILFLLITLSVILRLTPAFRNPSHISSSAITQTGYADSVERRISYIRTALETQTIYHNQYEVRYINFLNGKFIIDFDLNFEPADRWFFKNLISNIAGAYNRYGSGISAELNFYYNDQLCNRTILKHGSLEFHFPPRR